MRRFLFVVSAATVFFGCLMEAPAAGSSGSIASLDPAPPAPVVIDEGAYTTDRTTFRAWWSTAEIRGDEEFSYALGTTPGASDLADWTTTSAVAAEAVVPEQSYGTVVYFSVCVRRASSEWSEPGVSDGITVARQLSTTAEAKLLPNGEPVMFADNKPITAAFPLFCYVQDADGSAGIRVNRSGLVEGFYGRAAGVLGDVDGERCLLQGEVIAGSPSPAVRPRAMTAKMIGGGALYYDAATGAGQKALKAWRWVKVDEDSWERRLLDVPGANNTGLLIRTWGKVTSYAADSFYLDDGSGYDDTEDGSPPGVKVVVAPGIDVPSVGCYVVVTGISSTYLNDGTLRRLIRMREPGDLQMIIEVQ